MSTSNCVARMFFLVNIVNSTCVLKWHQFRCSINTKFEIRVKSEPFSAIDMKIILLQLDRTHIFHASGCFGKKKREFNIRGTNEFKAKNVYCARRWRRVIFYLQYTHWTPLNGEDVRLFSLFEKIPTSHSRHCNFCVASQALQLDRNDLGLWSKKRSGQISN